MDVGNPHRITAADTLRDIKRQFRLSMNGIVSTSMRERGIDYKVNFGLTRPMLKRLAAKYAQDKAVAQLLWNDTAVRESRLLAPMLCPKTDFSADDARRWMQTIARWEEADYCCMELFDQIDNGEELIREWLDSDKPIYWYTGFQLLNRLLLRSELITIELPVVLKKTIEILNSDQELALSAVVLNNLKRIIRSRKAVGQVVIQYLKTETNTDNDRMKNICSELQAEYDSFAFD